MIETGFDARVKISQVIENQLPEFLLSESPKAAEFLKQYYISQEYQGGTIDIVENLDQYLKLDNLTTEIISGKTILSQDISTTSTTISVDSTKGFPSQYGLLKIDDEIITYTSISGNTFIGCIRGFSGVTSYNKVNVPETLEFSTSNAASHLKDSQVVNLSALFLQEFYKKLKYTLTPGLENTNFVPDLDVSNFIKEAKSLYQSKGTPESFRILFNILYGETPKVFDLENLLIKPSTANFLRREVIVAELLNSPADPQKLIGQTIKKSTDSTTQAAVSEVEIITRNRKTYYKLSLFVGYNDVDLIEGQFNIQPKTKVLENVSVGASVISVDTTIGFGQTGTLISGSNKVNYTNKSVNQFYGCSNVVSVINAASDIRSDEYVYGYENGDETKKVELRITGVLSKFTPSSEIYYVDENEIISIKNVGEVIKNPENDKTYKQIFANSWIYNTSSRYQIGNISGSTFTLLSKPDKSSLKVGDQVDILARGTQNIVANGAVVVNINLLNNQVQLNNLGSFSPSTSLDYDLRRKIKKSSSTGASLEFGNNTLISDVQNLYVDGNEYAYVASNSLPSHVITKTLTESSIPEATGSPDQSSIGQGNIQGYSAITLKYSQISFSSDVPFISGDGVVYEAANPIPGLISGKTYYVEVLTPKNKIRLYTSRSFVGGSAYIEFDTLDAGSGSHRFILLEEKSKVISPQNLLRKFPLRPNLKNSALDRTQPGSIGMLINGVEITSPKSNDKLYYGPLESIKILNAGKNYDVINPPNISIPSPSIGTTAFAKVVISGSVKKVTVDPQEFDLSTVFSASISGGNGSGAILEPVVSRRYREVEFDARPLSVGGGLDLTNETITFKSTHNFTDGEVIIYNPNGNLSLGIGTFGSLETTGTLVNGSSYYSKIVNSSSIKLYNTLSDYVSGINTIGITTTNNAGIHKFRTLEKNTLRSIKVLNPGSNYQNRQLYVKPVGISTYDSTVFFPSHNFGNGDLINYNYTENAISGLSTTNSYFILKVDDDTFRLSDAGIGTVSTDNFERGKFVKLSSVGSGYHIFKYPDITVNINVSYGGTVIRQISSTPTVTGSIADIYLYEEGSGYGSDSILNLKQVPKITLQNGKNAELKPVIKDGKLIKVDVLSKGTEYFSTPSLIIQGSGVGAEVRPVITNNKITDVIIINAGIGYTQTDTTVKVVPAGSGALLEANIRPLTVNKQYRFNKEILVNNNNNLQYSWIGYDYSIAQTEFSENSSLHSPLIGWAYDGNPIYGPYGYSDSENNNSQVKILKPGYVLDTSKVTNRPSGFAAGFFIEDYVFNGSGDLDKHNGRFCKTPEFPLGVYAYFVGVDTNFSTNSLDPVYPYFIGDTYRSSLVTDNLTLDQKFDFNQSNLSRNTFPYKVNDPYADNDFIVESNEIINQDSIVESVSGGSITSLSILEPGSDYKVGDLLNFDNTETSGGGLSASVSSIIGKDIQSINTQVETYNSVVFEWTDNNTVVSYLTPYHQLLDNDLVVVSGLSTSIKDLSNSHKIGVTTERTTLFSDMPSTATPRAVIDIYVSNIPQTVSVGSSIVIENEFLEVLNIFPNDSIIRVRRSDVGAAHSISTYVNILPNKISIPLNTNYFDSKKNEKIYFNPKQSVGIGTTIGGSINLNYTIGNVTKQIFAPITSIYLPNHPFKTGQRVTLSKYSSSSAFIVSNSSGGINFNLPDSGNSQSVYIINKSKDFIGLTTQVGLTTNTNGLFFIGNGDDNYEYSLETNFSQVTGNIFKINSTISVSDSHELSNGDQITLQVNPDLTVGVGQSSKVRLKYQDSIKKILVNAIGFNSSSIDANNNIITINSHQLKTGDKVFYNSSDIIASGLSTGSYFVYEVDDNNIKLAETLSDLQSNPIQTVDIIGIGGSGHEISLVNPRLLSVKNNDLLFDLSHPSLVGNELKFYYDQEFTSEFIGLGNSSSFNISGVGTVGIGSTASNVLKYSSNIPSVLYYSLEKNGETVSSDDGVKNYSQILFVDSTYSGTYSISGVATTSFNISLNEIPEKLSYLPSECSKLIYTTTSKTAKGGINDTKIIFGGYDYKKLPKLLNISSDNGNGANIIANSTNVGLINKIRVIEPGFEYSVDKTLRPESYISPFISITKSNTIKKVNVIDGGKNYTVSPTLVVKNSKTSEIVDDIQSLKANIYYNSISSVEIVSPINGLESVTHEIISTNNSNGVGISSVISSSSGIVTCILSTPILGFSTFASPFSAGDKVLVENIQKEGSSGTGFNSADYNYSYFNVISYTNTNPAVLVYDMSSAGSNPGIAKTIQSGFASVINKKNLPQFEVIQEFTKFDIGEQLLSDLGSGFELRDLKVTKSAQDYIKVSGSYSLKNGEIIKGKNSGFIATINNVINYESKFNVDYSLRRDYGWSTDIGKLNESNQVSSDNDYYQNLSYTVKSTIQFEDLISPVNNLLHTSGLKNFADVQIESKPLIGYAVTAIIDDLVSLDITEEKRVDSINNYDLTLDINTYQGKSKYLKLKNKKLSSFINCVSNRVLIIDDISKQFSNRESNLNLYTDVSVIEDTYYKYLVQIKEVSTSNIQVSELVVLSNDDDVYTFEKSLLTNTNKVLGDLSGVIDNFDNKSLRFSPTNPYDYDYDIKVLQSQFNSSLVGINTRSVGFVNLTGVNTSVGIGTTVSVISFDKRFVKSLFANVQIINTSTLAMNYVEIFLDHDDTNTYLSEYYFDTGAGISTNSFGSFDSTIVGNNLSLNFYNDENNGLLIRSKIVGFGTTAVGVGTYRFISSGQTEGTERTAFFDSHYINSSSVANIIGINTDIITTVKSLVKVSCGQTSALHQVVMIQDNNDIYTLQYPFLSIGSTTGIGTFGGEYSGNEAILKFYPDNNITSFNLQSFNEVLYTENDYDNIPPDLDYGPVTESLGLSLYNGINGSRINRVNFNLNHQGTPIYAKTFNPSSTSQLNFETGIFTIKDHFFNTGERLLYTPKSTFIGIAATSVGIGSTLSSSGIVTNRLPSEVYAININSDQFRLSTRKDYALAGIYVTFTSSGTGNAHQLEMSKKFEKSIISINGVVQKPISYVPISYQLVNNGGQIGVANTYFSISGITSLRLNDILKIDDEFINIISIGLGTSPVGPITGIGTYQLIEGKRGFVGTSATNHLDSSTIQLYRGSFNIVGSEIYFTEPPKGGGGIRNTNSNLEFPYADFSGRVYLKNDYTNNLLFDDISDQFNGLEKTFNLSVQGIKTTGIETGSGVLFINDIFQPPTTNNNLGNNYSVVSNAGISSVIFTGITSSNGDLIISDFDVNQNQLPRGGLIVSLGSTPGLGFAPLVGASVTAVVSGGSIISVGIGTTDIVGSGYRGTVSIGVTDSLHVGAAATITATVGAGGTLSFNVIYGGSGYVRPTIKVPQPSYENLEVIGVSRIGIGSTTTTGKNLLITLDVGASSTTGIGSTLFEVTSFKISRPGYGFKIGDVFKPVGLVTDKNLSRPIADFELTVTDTFTDSFSAWQFGELDYIDSIKNLQDGSRVRFPLYYNGRLLSFEKDPSSLIDLNAVLLIFINGVIQEPEVAYQFEGGTSFTFTTPPRTEDKISVFFYRGSRGTDSTQINVNETIKIGDLVQVYKNDLNPNTITQEIRSIDNIPASDILETNIYTDRGIDEVNYRPFTWTKQKVDRIINGDYVYKSRDSIEPQIYPTARIIKNVGIDTTSIFVDNAKFFNYEGENYSGVFTINKFNTLILQGTSPVSAGLTATVSTTGTIQSLTITNPGSGYIGTSIDIKISAPSNIKLGIGTTATAIASIVNGSVSTPITITNSGLGYTTSAPPQVIVNSPSFIFENVTAINGVEGFSGIVTGITTSSGVGGHPLALKFFLNSNSFSGLQVGYPLYIFDTSVGYGVTSVDTNNTSIVGIGTSFVDNIYYIHSISSSGGNAEILCNILSTTNISGVNTFGSTSSPRGKFSWGRIYNFNRSNPVSIAVTGLTIDSGLSTFPVIQRRGYGLRDTGAITKISDI